MIVLGRKPGGGGSGPGGGVTSVAKQGDAGLTGAVTFSEGAGVTLTQVGQDIEVAASGSELAYVEVTNSVTVSGSEGTPTDVVSAGAVAFNGTTRVCVEFYCPVASTGTGTNEQKISFGLWDDSTELALIGQVEKNVSTSAAIQASVFVKRYLTPSNASHTYSIKAWKVGANATALAGAGSGGAGIVMPIYIRITTV